MTSETISPRKIKARRLAHAAMKAQAEGRTLADVGREFYPNADHPSQTVVNCLKQPTAQAEMAKIQAELYDETLLKTELAKLIKSEKRDGIKVKALELGMRSLAMLTDKSQVTTQQALPNLAEMLKTGQITAQDLERTLLQHLRVSSQGVDTQAKDAPQSTEDASQRANG